MLGEEVRIIAMVLGGITSVSIGLAKQDGIAIKGEEQLLRNVNFEAPLIPRESL